MVDSVKRPCENRALNGRASRFRGRLSSVTICDWTLGKFLVVGLGKFLVVGVPRKPSLVCSLSVVDSVKEFS